MTPRVRAFLHVVRVGEGTADARGYHRLFGGQEVEDLSDHPRTLVVRGSYRSTAAGAYQALERTWDDFIRAEGPHDFSPASQDEFAMWCLTRRKALDAIEEGDLDTALERCSWEWASLPAPSTGTGRYGQPVISLAKARALFHQALKEKPMSMNEQLRQKLTDAEYAALMGWLDAEAGRRAKERAFAAVKGAGKSWTVRLNALAGAIALAWPHLEPHVAALLGPDAVARLVALYAALNIALRAKTDKPLAER